MKYHADRDDQSISSINKVQMMDQSEYQKKYNDDSTPGWDAIDAKLTEVYGTQEPPHWGTMLSYMLGGPDPLDGISAYTCEEGGREHLHFVTYGYSSLYYDEEATGGDFSKFGFEMTFRLVSPVSPAEEPIWVCNLLQNLARYVFDSGKWFENYHWIPANGPINVDYGTDLVGFIFVSDPVLNSIDTPHGKIEFLQAFGITQSELDSLMENTRTVEEIIDVHRKTNPLLITDLDRKDG